MPETVHHELISIECLGEKMAFEEKVISAANGRKVRFVVDDQHKTNSDFHLGLFFSKAVFAPDVFRYPKPQRLAVLSETPFDPSHRRVDEVLTNFDVVFTHQRHLYEQGPPFFPLMLGTNWLVGDDVGKLAPEEIAGRKDQLVSFVGSIEHEKNAGYTLRHQVCEMIIADGTIPCFGRGIQPFESKRDVTEPFMFCIVMENFSQDYYFTEKLVDCLLLETIPIYFGCPGIGSVFDERGLLQFKDLDELRSCLHLLSPDLYRKMRPFALNNRDLAIKNGWISHEGLLRRVIESLPENLLKVSPVSYGSIRRSVGYRILQKCLRIFS